MRAKMKSIWLSKTIGTTEIVGEKLNVLQLHGTVDLATRRCVSDHVTLMTLLGWVGVRHYEIMGNALSFITPVWVCRYLRCDYSNFHNLIGDDTIMLGQRHSLGPLHITLNIAGVKVWLKQWQKCDVLFRDENLLITLSAILWENSHIILPNLQI